MGTQTTNGARFRFGAFELDLRTGELRKNGTITSLPPQPCKILALLVSQPGELVTREAIQEQIWGNDTFVDFENGLNFAIRRIRTVLGDDAESPRYIETLPRRGYRFIAAVEVIALEAVPAWAPKESATALAGTDEDVRSEAPVVRTPPYAASTSKRLGLSISVSALLVASVILLVLRLGRVSHGAFTASAPPQVRIVVLPFVNLTGDERREYLCDGLTEEMIAVLSRLSPGQLDVIARTSAMQYKGTSKSVAQIGRELNVNYLLENNVREFGGRLRVTTQLVRVSDASHVWAGEYDRDVRDVLQLQQQVAMAIVAEMKVNLTPADGARMRSAYVVDPQAYRDYLLGRYYWNKRTPAYIQKSADSFRQALREDPNFALAYAGLADSLVFSDEPQSTAEAKDAARRAIELDGALGEPHASLAFVALMRDWDWPGAEREFRRALELNPAYPTAHHWFGMYFETSGRRQEAIEELNRALELDPLSLVIRTKLADLLSEDGQHEKALEETRKVLDMDPNFTQGHRCRAWIYERKRMFPEAVEELKKARELGSPPEWIRTDLAYAHAVAGDRVAAEKAIDGLERQAKRAGEPPQADGIAMIYVGLGDHDQAFDWLERARQQRSEQLLELMSNPAFDPMRSDPRFQALLRRMNLPNNVSP